MKTRNKNYWEEALNRLKNYFYGCDDEMHEPDNQGFEGDKIRLLGDHLDNAFGSSHPDDNCGEYVLEVRYGPAVHFFNLANLIALARQANLSDESSLVAMLRGNLQDRDDKIKELEQQLSKATEETESEILPVRIGPSRTDTLVNEIASEIFIRIASKGAEMEAL